MRGLNVCLFGPRRRKITRQWFVDHRYVLYLYFVTYFVIMPLVLINLPYSVFNVNRKSHSEAIQDIEKVNQRRIVASQEFIRNFRLDETNILSKLSNDDVTKPVEIGITIITMSRNSGPSLHETKYLTQVVAKLLKLLTEETSLRDKLKIFICDVDAQPHRHKELADLYGLLPVFHNHSKSSLHWHDKLDLLDKEKWDYIYCLRETVRRVNSYALMLEDDAYPLDDFLSALKHLIDVRIPYIRRDNRTHPAYFKLYHPQRVLGYWSLESERIPELISIAAFVGTVAFLALKSMSTSTNRSYSLWFMLCVYFFVLSMLIGRQNLLELRRLSYSLFVLSKAPQCCTPSFLYTKSSAQRMIRYLSGVECSRVYPMDFAIYDITSAFTNTRAYMFQPNIVQHIGLYSTLHDTATDPFNV